MLRRVVRRRVASVSGTTGFLTLRDEGTTVDDIAKSVERWTHHNADVEVRIRILTGARLQTEQSRYA